MDKQLEKMKAFVRKYADRSDVRIDSLVERLRGSPSVEIALRSFEKALIIAPSKEGGYDVFWGSLDKPYGWVPNLLGGPARHYVAYADFLQDFGPEVELVESLRQANLNVRKLQASREAKQ